MDGLIINNVQNTFKSAGVLAKINGAPGSSTECVLFLVHPPAPEAALRNSSYLPGKAQGPLLV